MYKSKHGTFKDSGEELHSTITGQGLLPCGRFRVTVSSLTTKDGVSTLILDEPAKGFHIEEISNPPPLKVGEVVEVEIGLGEGVYARRNSKGLLALFDAQTQEKRTSWTKNVVQYLRHHTLAEPHIVSIKNKQGEELWHHIKIKTV